MPYRVLLYAPDRGVLYDGRTPEETGVGGGITARLSLLSAMAELDHDVTAYVNCAAPVEHRGVRYLPLNRFDRADTDIFIAITTGGDLSFAALRGRSIRARLKIVWVQGVPMPDALDAVDPDYVYVASNFLREVCETRWQVPADKLFVCYNGIDQDRFARVDAAPPERDPFALAYIGPPEKGLAAGVEVLRRLRRRDTRFHLDVFGGSALWGRAADPPAHEPGLAMKGLLGQRALVPELFRYEYCLALQAMEEGFGIAVQEARRAGAIVVASAVGAFPELIRSGQTGFLVPGAHDDSATQDRVADLISNLAADPSRRARLRANGATTPWSWSVAAKTWVAHWDYVIDGRSSGVVTTRASGSERDGGPFLDLPDGRHSIATGEYVPAVDPFSPLLDRAGRGTHVFLAGYYGHANLGDDAILHVTLEELRRRIPALSVTVVSGNPTATRTTADVDAVDEHDVPAIVRAAERCDAIVLGGGGLFHDYHGVDEATTFSRLHWGLTFCAMFPALAAMLGKPFVVHAVGVGPLATDAGRRYTRLTFDRADVATVRDEASAALLADLGVDPGRIAVTADPAVLIATAPADLVATRMSGLGITASRRRIGVALRSWGTPEAEAHWQTTLATALDRIITTLGADVVFVAFQAADGAAPGDRDCARRVSALMSHQDAIHVVDAELWPTEMQGVLATCDVVVAMRLHAVLLAANAAVPVVALAYDPKVTAATRALGLEDYAIDLASATAERIAERVEQAQAARSDIRRRLQARHHELEAAAQQGIDVIAAAIATVPAKRPVAADALTVVLHQTLMRQASQIAVLETQVDRLGGELAAQDRAAAETRDLLAQATDELAAKNGVLFDELQSADASFAPLVEDFEATYRSRAWRTVLRYRALRRHAGYAVRHPLAATRRLARRATMAVVPAPQRQALRQAWSRVLMNPYMYFFDRYKRTRLTVYGPDLAGVTAPGEAGLVSIVLPVYNGESMIGESIASVLAQTYSQFELIVVDDGSTDGTPALVDAIAGRDPRVRVIHQHNQKLPRALNRGFAEARGEFLTWTSADNRLKPEFLSRLVDCLQRHPRWDMAYANLDVIDETGAFARHSPHYEGYQRPHGSEHVHLPTSTAELNVWPNNYVGAAFMYRSRVRYLIGDYSRHRFVLEDYDYWMRVNALATLRHADFAAAVYDYRFHGQSLTSDWARHQMFERRERLMVFEEFRRDFYLSPMVWVLDGQSGAAEALRERITRAGHLLYDGTYALTDLPDVWVPVVYVKSTAAPQSATVDTTLPASALKVLLTSSGSLPNAIDDAWDLAVAVGGNATPTRLAKAAQGWVRVNDASSLFLALDARAKSSHLSEIEALAESPPPPALRASVILCTHRFNDRVVTAMRAVMAQTFPASDYELIVVNNDPRKTVAATAIQTLQAQFTSARIRYVLCPITGLSAARNAGLAAARGEIVCFLDDDAIAAPDWLEKVVDAFAAHPKTAVIGGHIVLNIPEPRPAALRQGWEKYWSQYLTSFREYTEVKHWWEYPWGANWSARRAALIAVGGFRLKYGRTGDDFWGGEELVAAALMQTLGGVIAVLPEATVRHDVDAARFSFEHVRRTMTAGHLASYQAQRDLYIPKESGVRTTLALLVARHVDAGVPLRHRGRDAFYRKAAQLRLLLAQLRDVWRRRRAAVVASDAP